MDMKVSQFQLKVQNLLFKLIREIIQFNTPEPNVLPCSNGSLQLEWHIDNIDCEIEIFRTK